MKSHFEMSSLQKRKFKKILTCVTDANSCALDSTNESGARLHEFPGPNLQQPIAGQLNEMKVLLLTAA
jgi:hypothetical protein